MRLSRQMRLSLDRGKDGEELWEREGRGRDREREKYKEMREVN